MNFYFVDFNFFKEQFCTKYEVEETKLENMLQEQYISLVKGTKLIFFSDTLLERFLLTLSYLARVDIEYIRDFIIENDLLCSLETEVTK